MIFSCMFRQTASVVNLPRSSLGSGETIARSRNSEHRPGHPLPKDYINASRRLQIGRCPLPFLAARPTQTDVEEMWNATWGPLRVGAAYDYRKHPSSHLGRFFVLRERENEEEKSFEAGRDNNGEVKGVRERKGGTQPRVLVVSKFEGPRGWPVVG